MGYLEWHITVLQWCLISTFFSFNIQLRDESEALAFLDLDENSVFFRPLNRIMPKVIKPIEVKINAKKSISSGQTGADQSILRYKELINAFRTSPRCVGNFNGFTPTFLNPKTFYGCLNNESVKFYHRFTLSYS